MSRAEKNEGGKRLNERHDVRTKRRHSDVNWAEEQERGANVWPTLGGF